MTVRYDIKGRYNGKYREIGEENRAVYPKYMRYNKDR